MQIYEQWDSGRPYPHPASLAFWEHERERWLTHIVQNVLSSRLADKATDDLRTRIERQPERQRQPQLELQQPQHQPYLHDGKPMSNPAEISLRHIGQLLHLSEPLQQLVALAWCVGREASLTGDRTLASALAACQFGDSSKRSEWLAALLDADETLCQHILAPPFALVAVGILNPMAWHTATSLLDLCSATDHFVDVVDGTYLPWRLPEALRGSDFDTLAFMDESEDVLESEIEREYGSHPIADVYRDGARLHKLSAVFIVTLVHWLTGLRLLASDVRLLDRQLDICDVRGRVHAAALDAMTRQQTIDELLLLRALYAPRDGDEGADND